MENKTSNLKTLEVIPAVLQKSYSDLIDAINKVRDYVKTIQIDVMDGKFVPNKTVSLDDLKRLPSDLKYEFHWMVENPAEWIKEIKGNNLHLVHVETIKDKWEEIKDAVKGVGGRIGLVINPETPIENIMQYAKQGCEEILVMAVHPGFSGQKYIKEVEQKITYLRNQFPDMDIEVDGGVDLETAASAVKAGANKLAAASSIFKAENIKEAVEKLLNAGEKGRKNE